MNTDKQIPENFKNIIFDMIDDFSTTFPEYSETLYKWNRANFKADEDSPIINELFEYCLSVYPKHFFNILYQNTDMFNDETINTHFLPNIDFKNIISDASLSDKTKQIIWKYLQLILFTVIGTIKEKTEFGDYEKMFADVNSEEIQEKINETITNMMGFFGSAAESEPNEQSDTNSTPNSTPGPNYIPNPNELNDHLSGLFDGKIGKFAKELAENISDDFCGLLGENITETSTPKDVMFNLMKNPNKISGIVKTVTSKLTEKIASGEISKEELMKEATEMMGKFKGMKGMGQFDHLFKNMAGMADLAKFSNMDDVGDLFRNVEGMAGPNIPKNARVDANAMDRRAKYQSISDRLKTKLDEKRKSVEINTAEKDYSLEKTDNKNDFVFKLNKDEVQPKTPLKLTNSPSKNCAKEEDWLEEIIADQSSIIGKSGSTQPKETKKKKKNKK
jgi:hypothetical protein